MNANAKSLLERREKLLGSAYRLFYDQPVEFVRGEGVWLYDVKGNAFLDCYNNVPHVGHCHPRVVEALCEQAGTLNTHTRYVNERVVDYAERLTATLPDPLNVVMFACTGSEANDLALRVARAHTGGCGIVVTENAYHGNTRDLAAISVSYENFEGLGAHVRTVPAPATFRGCYVEDDAAERYANHVKTAFDDLAASGHQPAAFIVDTIFASDGIITPPGNYLDLAVAHTHAAGAVFVADEVQPGFGRTGDHMWGFQRHGVCPDIVTMGKPMGNGHPVSAMVTSKAILKSFGESTRYFNTFGGNPVSSAVGLAVLDVIQDEGLLANARTVGAYLREGLESLARDYPILADVRGAGLFNAVELIREDEPDPASAKLIVNAMRDRGVLIGATGPCSNVLKVRPPMPFTEQHADRFLGTLREVMSSLS